MRTVVIAGEVGGRWSEETKVFFWSLACEKSRSEAGVLRGSVRVAWYRRWSCLLACAWSVEESQGLGMIHPLPTKWWLPRSATCGPCSGLTVHISFVAKKKLRFALWKSIESTKFFIERAKKRVSSCREDVAKAQAVLRKAEAKVLTEEDSLRDGESRLAALQLEAQ